MDTKNWDVMVGPSDYRKLETVHQKFIRWQINIIWKKLFEIFKGNKKFEWLMIDSTYAKTYQHSCGDCVEKQLHQRQNVDQFEDTFSHPFFDHLVNSI